MIAATTGRDMNERACIAALLRAPEGIPRVLERIGPPDLRDPKLGCLLGRLGEMHAAGIPIELPILADELDRAGELEKIGGPVTLAELVDFEATGALATYYATRIRRDALEDIRGKLYDRAKGDPDSRIREEIAKVDALLDGLEIGDGPPRGLLEKVSFSGPSLLALLSREAPLPIEAARPVPGHFATLIAPPMVGKTTLALWNGMARAAGVAPWPGVEARPAGRVLFYSIDEAPEQVVRRMRGLSLFHPARQLEAYAARLVVAGPDRELAPAALESLRFDESGLATLERWLSEAEAAGEPFAELYVDAYADVIPTDKSENDNGEATRIGGALERIAVRHGVAIVLLHHSGKPKADAGEELPDVRYLGRGASALAAKARAVTSLELVGGMPNLRRVRTATNLGRTPRPVLFEVCSPESTAEELIYFRPAADPRSRDPRELLSPGETITTGELARRLAGDSLADGAEPPGDLKRLAASLRESWRMAGKVTVGSGPRGAKTLTLVEIEKDSP